VGYVERGLLHHTDTSSRSAECRACVDRDACPKLIIKKRHLGMRRRESAREEEAREPVRSTVSSCAEPEASADHPSDEVTAWRAAYRRRDEGRPFLTRRSLAKTVGPLNLNTAKRACWEPAKTQRSRATRLAKTDARHHGSPTIEDVGMTRHTKPASSVDAVRVTH
jgi:hypothetical protein